MKREPKVGDHVLVKLSGGRIVEATIKAVVETTEGVALAGVIRRRDGAGLFVADRHRGSLIVRSAPILEERRVRRQRIASHFNLTPTFWGAINQTYLWVASHCGVQFVF